MTPADKIIRAKSSLILDHPFYATLLLSMNVAAVNDGSIETMATDGDNVFYNPAWIDTLPQSEVLFVLAHEVLHCVFDHMGRRESRDARNWNIAADYIVNGQLVADKIGVMPKVGLLDDALVQRGKGTTEGVYALLQSPAPSPKDGKGKSGGKSGKPQGKPGQPGEPLDDVRDSAPDPAGKAEKTARMKQRVAQAAQAAKMSGKLSDSLERLVGNALKPKVDWRDALRRFISVRAKSEPTFARPKRRFLSQGIYLPSNSGHRLGKITVAVDCSGSVSRALLEAFASEIASIKSETKPAKLDVVYFDSKVLRADSFGPDDDFEVHAVGGGGTAFSPVFEAIDADAEKNDGPPDAVIVLTDLYCNDFGPTPAYPVLWAVISGGNQTRPPFGETIEVETHAKD